MPQRRVNTPPLDYLRISVTDKCEMACVYCSPGKRVKEKGVGDPAAKVCDPSFLTPAEIERVVAAARRLGVSHVRLTGGEPLERPDLLEIVDRLGRLGVPDLSMTTNGRRLAGLAADLRRAGLGRVNLGLPHVTREGFRSITGCDALAEVVDGLAAATAAGLAPIKINTVVLRGLNDAAVREIADFAEHLRLIPRFIEYMAPGENQARALFVSTAETVARFDGHLAARPAAVAGPAGAWGGPARYYRLAGGGIVGFISPVSRPFCGECTRLRLSAEGMLRSCLYHEPEIDLAPLLRAGAPAAVIEEAIRHGMTMKPTVHGPALPRVMRCVGG